MNGPTPARRIGAFVLAIVLLTLSASMAWAAANDLGSRGLVPAGVSVAGTDLSGMSEPQARDAIRRAVSAPLMRPVSVAADGHTYSFDPRGAIRVDVDAMVAEAYEPRKSASYLARLRADIAGVPLTTVVEPAYSVDREVLDQWLAGVARDVNRRAIDATVTISDSRVRVRPSSTGRRLDRAAAADTLAAAFAAERALADAERSVELTVGVLRPRITEKDIGKTIVVDISERRIRLFDGAKLEKAYRCAVGTASYPTPRGEFEILLKRYMPSWSNPAPNGWGADMPAYIPPGPGNPLGTRAINLSAPGIRFHGTTNIGSVGTAASHGCMRMYRSDIEDLYERVDVGMKVYIVD